ncbi:MAG TPA: hypothetical protein VLD39_07925 [Gammaproteobacteria bacterium]|nr:hypothetical protein [Gammaproteobacteria bacterium]
MLRQRLALISLSLCSVAVMAQETVPARASESPPTIAGTAAPAPEAPQAATEAPAGGQPGVKTLSGMSILGNEEAPKSLVIVPWKSSEIGDGIGVDDAIDDRARPVDKEVFLRELRYYQLRSGEGGG